jgi:hypothetical protein
MSATEFEMWSLAAQWVGSGAAVAAVGVAIAFGIITLRTSRQSKDAQERSAVTAAAEQSEQDFNAVFNQQSTEFQVDHIGGENFTVMNHTVVTMYDLRVEGLTDQDKRRLTVTTPLPVAALESGQTVEFVLVSRFTLSGPANLVVTYAIDADGIHRARKVLLVPKP